MYLAASLAVLSIMLIALFRAFLGPTLFDRILAINMFGTKTVLLVAVIGVTSLDYSFLDVALVYALINFISVLAVLRFFEYGKQSEDSPDHAEESP
jgi:multicomponent Na+:H+ antiporter subunit F